MSLSDLGGGAINNDGRFVDGSGTAAGEPGAHTTSCTARAPSTSSTPMTATSRSA